MAITNPVSSQLIATQVQLALREDVGSGDLTADLIPEHHQAAARLITRESAILCGSDWFNEVFRQLDLSVHIDWHCHDGDSLSANQVLCDISGPASSILTAERTAMNFLQTLSATATAARQYADAVADLDVTVLDTRKTLPGYRLAQKYAAVCGGCSNHRIGLFDGILIKENHIAAAGSIEAAVTKAKQLHPSVSIEVEVESLDEMQQAIQAGADIILLDNFSVEDLRVAVQKNSSKALLEASGGINLDTIRAIAETGVDRISVGQFTKDIRAIDLSLRFI
jgi:nicotinate-nucleotide pyrophosphorylase (carboxylating)